MKPAVTVLVDTYNHERFIEEAIVRVLDQDFPSEEMEILVVDDGSTDRTPEIVRKFEPRVRLIRKANGGQASAFNMGISEARGAIISFLDGDDWWAPTKLTRVLGAMAADPEVGMVGNGIIIVQQDGREQLETLRDGFRFRANSLEGALLFRRRGSLLGTSRMTIRTELLRRIGPIPEEITIQADEYLFTLAAVLAGVQILPEALTYYRLHGANLFQLSGRDAEKLRRKQEVLTALVSRLSNKIADLGINSQVRHKLLEYTEANADQFRLMLDGGFPWETVATEWKLYGVLHPEAPLSHRAFKVLTLVAAFAMPPRGFYKMQRKFAQNGLYLRARQRWLPVPEMPHLRKDWREGS